MKSQQPSQGRVSFYDIAKGIGIILVYIGHVTPYHEVRQFIYSFHMPLFFVISGMLLHEDKYSLNVFFISRAKSLLWPAFYFSVFAYLCSLFTENISMPGLLVDLPSALWFLPVLFCAEVVVFSLWNIIRSKLYRAMLCVVLSCIGMYLDSMGIDWPWSLNAVPIAAMFLGLGNIVKDYYPRIKSYNYHMIISVIGFALILLFVLLSKETTSIHENHFALNYWFGIFLAVVGIAATLSLSYIFDRIEACKVKRLLTMFGRYSLDIYGLHFTLLSVIGNFRYIIPFQVLRYVVWNAMVITIMVILIRCKHKIIRHNCLIK